MVIALSANDADRHTLREPEIKYVANIHGNEVGVLKNANCNCVPV